MKEIMKLSLEPVEIGEKEEEEEEEEEGKPPRRGFRTRCCRVRYASVALNLFRIMS